MKTARSNYRNVKRSPNRTPGLALRPSCRIDRDLRILAVCLILAMMLPALAGAAPDGCSDASASVQVQSEDASYTYYVVATTVTPDAKAKKQKAERVILLVDAKLAVEGVDKDGVPYREEVSLQFRLAGVRYGSYSRTVKGEIRGPLVNRHILGVTIQRVACQWQEPGDETEDSSVT
jgi:hypothetical protein